MGEIHAPYPDIRNALSWRRPCQSFWRLGLCPCTPWRVLQSISLFPGPCSPPWLPRPSAESSCAHPDSPCSPLASNPLWLLHGSWSGLPHPSSLECSSYLPCPARLMSVIEAPAPGPRLALTAGLSKLGVPHFCISQGPSDLGDSLGAGWIYAAPHAAQGIHLDGWPSGQREREAFLRQG